MGEWRAEYGNMGNGVWEYGKGGYEEEGGRGMGGGSENEGNEEEEVGSLPCGAV